MYIYIFIYLFSFQHLYHMYLCVRASLMSGILFWWSVWQDKYGKMLGELRESVMGTEAGQWKSAETRDWDHGSWVCY
jgi:hypothetical protein